MADTNDNKQLPQISSLQAHRELQIPEELSNTVQVSNLDAVVEALSK